jgi:hypothetical protein
MNVIILEKYIAGIAKNKLRIDQFTTGKINTESSVRELEILRWLEMSKGEP